MSTTLTPPPLQPVAGPPPQPEPQTPGTRTSSKVIAILTMALGGATFRDESRRSTHATCDPNTPR